MSCQTNRRGFLKSAALPAAGWVILGSARSARSYQANEKLNVAVVGVGKRGRWHVSIVPRVGQNLVALCDANHRQAADVFKKHTAVPKYRDFRKMLDEMDRQIDALVIATPCHTHAVIAARAMKRGKHVYVEKPLAHDVDEARTLRRIANEQKVATQQGNQGMATDSFRRTLELVQEGAIGEIREAHVWFVSGGSGPRQRPKDTPPVPDYLDWDCFLGPAPFRPYHPSYVTGWGAWREYGTGCLGGGGSHSINMAFKGLNLGALWEGEGKGPIRVETEIPEACPENFPRWQICRFDIPARGSLPPAQIHWYNAPEQELKRHGIWDRLEKIAGRSLEWKDGSWTPRCSWEQRALCTPPPTTPCAPSCPRPTSRTLAVRPTRSQASQATSRNGSRLARVDRRRFPTSIIPARPLNLCCSATSPRWLASRWSSIPCRARSPTTTRPTGRSAPNTGKVGLCERSRLREQRRLAVMRHQVIRFVGMRHKTTPFGTPGGDHRPPSIGWQMTGN